MSPDRKIQISSSYEPFQWRPVLPHPFPPNPSTPDPAAAPSIASSKSLGDGGAGADAAQGAGPRERGGRSLPPREAAVDEGAAGRFQGAPGPHVRQSLPQCLRRQ